MVPLSSSTTMDSTSAGDMALITSCAGLSSHSTISTRSLSSSFETACTREPRMPTHAPTGSIRWSLVFTAILAREPGSRAAARIWMTSSAISGTSILNSSINISGQERLRINWGPRPSSLISLRIARTRSLTRNVSRPTSWSRGNSPSALLPRSTMTLSRVTFFTVPATSTPTLLLYCSTTCARSASRTRCTITCLAVWAAMRPKPTFSTFSSWISPGFSAGSISIASSVVNWVPSSAISSSGTTSQRRTVT